MEESIPSARGLREVSFSSQLLGHTDCVDYIRLDETNRRLVSASHDSTLKLWDYNAEQCVQTIQAHNEGVYCVDISPNKRIMTSCSPDSSIAVWDPNNGNLVGRCQKGHNYRVMHVLFVSENDFISCGRDKQMLQWDARNLKNPKRSFSNPQSEVFRSATVNADQSLLVGSTEQSSLEVYDFRNGNWLYTHHVQVQEEVIPQSIVLFDPPNYIYCSRFFKTQAQRLISVHQDLASRQFMVTPEGMNDERIFRSHCHFVRHIEISPNEQLYATTSQDGGIRVWDSALNRPQLSLAGHNDVVTCAAFTEDNSTLFTSSYDQSIKVFRIN